MITVPVFAGSNLIGAELVSPVRFSLTVWFPTLPPRLGMLAQTKAAFTVPLLKIWHGAELPVAVLMLAVISPVGSLYWLFIGLPFRG